MILFLILRVWAMNDLIQKINDFQVTDYFSLTQSLRSAGSSNIDINQELIRKYQKLENAASLIFNADNKDCPLDFSAYVADKNGKKKYSLGNFDNATLDFFSDLIDKISHPLLKARLADILWLKKRDHNKAEIAIDSYITSFALDTIKSYDKKNFLTRSVILAKQLRKEDKIDEIASTVFAAFQSTPVSEFLPIVNYARILYLCKDNRQIEAIKISNKLLQVTEIQKQSGNFHFEEKSIREAQKWFEHKSSDFYKCYALLGNCFERRSESVSGALPKQVFIRDAINTYRIIPNNMRDSFGITSDRLVDLFRQSLNLGESTLKELSHIPIKMPDFDELIEDTKKQVKEQTALNALCMLSSLPLFKYEENWTSIQNDPSMIIGLIATVLPLDSTGQYDQNYSWLGEKSTNDERARFSHLLNLYNCHLLQRYSARITPILEAIKEEHYINKDHFLDIVQNAVIIPADHKQICAKGLYAGYIGDWITSIHVLAPILECTVRSILEVKNIATTSSDKEGHQMEVGLSNLILKSETKKILGEDLTFEIYALFCCNHYANFRNKVAHGLITDSECHSTEAFYAWWLVFKIVFISFFRNTSEEERQNLFITKHDNT